MFEPRLGQVLAGTHSGIYESTDGAASWTFRNETTGWGNVQSFREGLIQGRPYVLANSQNGILTMPRAVSRSPEPKPYISPALAPSLGLHPNQGGRWQKIAAPGGIASNAHLSVAVHDGTPA